MPFASTEALRSYISTGATVRIEKQGIYGTFTVTDGDAPTTPRQHLFDEEAWAFEFEDDSGLMTTYRYVLVEPNRFGGDGCVALYRLRKRNGEKDYASPVGHVPLGLEDIHPRQGVEVQDS